MIRIAPPPLRPKHIEERLKLAANGLQAIALAVLVSAFLAPAFSASVNVPLWWKLLAGAVITEAELAAFLLLRYIPLPEETTP